MLKRYKYLSVMSGRDKRMMDDYSGALDTLQAQRERLANQKASYEKLKTRRDSEARKVQAEEANKKTLLASIKKQKASYLAMQKELEDSGSRMKELIRTLEAAAKARPVTPGPVTGRLKSGLEWPVAGKVISRFGKQKHPEYDTFIYKKGIELQAKLGESVHAVDAAEVVFADWFKGLGLVAILQHGGDFYTVYAHLSDVKVRTGDKVARGQDIASVGDTGAPSGPSLYFEIRKGSDAVDPLTFLKPR
jgi:septal ring factor EnvC (AmiA/AmiB activator)